MRARFSIVRTASISRSTRGRRNGEAWLIQKRYHQSLSTRPRAVEILVFAVCSYDLVHTACVYKSLSPARSILRWLVEPKVA